VSIERGSFANGVYRAEWYLFAISKRKHVNEPMALADARDLVHTYLPRSMPVERIRAARGMEHDGGRYGYPCREFPLGRIRLGSHAPKWVVLHELAHALATVGTGERAHGPQFRKAYVHLVDAEMGEWWGRRLREALRRSGYEVEA
jgi:putative metallohydrolase (TIGR04338 family)